MANSSLLWQGLSNGFCGRLQRQPSLRKFRPRVSRVRANIDICNPDDFEVQRLLGTYGYMNITSYGGPQQLQALPNQPAGLDEQDVRKRITGQEVGEGGVQTRIYAGRISRGPRAGTRVILKAYPGRNVAGIEADVMAANELSTHAVLQENAEGDGCPNVVYLLGGFQTLTGEQWLAFRDDGQFTAADYAKAASVATTEGRSLGDWEFLDFFDLNRPITRRCIFIIKLLRGVFSGLGYMHSKGRLHQSLGPASVVINTMMEKDVYFLVPQLRDMAFSVDVSYAGGLLMAYMIFIPLCKSGSIDGPSLQVVRIFLSIGPPGSKRVSDFMQEAYYFQAYCLADERWVEAVKFLDLGDQAGWELLQAMLNPDYRQRPIAEAILNHRFMTGALF